jgi:hypothetical protein
VAVIKSSATYRMANRLTPRQRRSMFGHHTTAEQATRQPLTPLRQVPTRKWPSRYRGLQAARKVEAASGNMVLAQIVKKHTGGLSLRRCMLVLTLICWDYQRQSHLASFKRQEVELRNGCVEGGCVGGSGYVQSKG